MSARASGLGMGVGMFSRPLRGVGVLTRPDAVLDTTRRVESVCQIPLGAGVLRLLVAGVAVAVLIDHHWVADGVISATRELFSQDEWVEF